MKQDLKILFVTILVIVLGYFGYQYYKNSKTGNYDSLPEFTITDLQGNAFSSKHLATDKKKILIYFNSECEHCQYEAELIQEHLDKFKNVQLVFISYQETELITEFAAKYGFLNKEFIIFLEDKKLALINLFDIKAFPCILIYSEDNALLEKFEGPTAISKIINPIEQH